MPAYEAFGRTDTTNDPRVLYGLTQTGNRKQRKAAELRLQEISHDQDLAQHQAQFDASHAQTERLRGDALSERRDIFDERQAQRQDFHDAQAGENAIRMKALQQQADTARLNALQLQLGDPNLKDQHPAIKNEIMRILGVQNNVATGGTAAGVTPAAAAGKGEYGPGGAPKAPNAGGAPPTTQPATYTPPTGAFTGQPAPQTGGELPAVGPTGAVDQGGGFAPNGYPILPNTPEPRYTPLGHGSLEGSTQAQGGIQTPSGGFIGTKITPGVADLVDPTGGAATVARQTEAGYAPGSQGGIPFRGTGGYTPPTTSFTTGGSSAQPGAAPAPTSNVPAPINVGLGVPGQEPVNLFSVGLNPNVPSNQRQDAAAATASGQPQVFSAGSNQAEDFRNSGAKAYGPSASNDRTDLLRDAENTFYGGGQAPAPTPKPTPAPPHLAAAHQMLADYYRTLA